MALDNVFRSQQDEKDASRRAWQMAWDKLQEKHQAYYSAVGGRENVSDEQKQVFDNEISAFNREWHPEKGRLAEEVDRKQSDERINEASGTTQDSREERKKRMIAEQKAIISRQRNIQQNNAQQATKSAANQNQTHFSNVQQQMAEKIVDAKDKVKSEQSEREQRKTQFIAEQKAIVERSQNKKKSK